MRIREAAEGPPVRQASMKGGWPNHESTNTPAAFAQAYEPASTARR
jgi:hypothetical protein